MVTVTKEAKGYTLKVSVYAGHHSNDQRLSFQLEDNGGRSLINAIMTTRRGIIAFLECFFLTGNNRKDQLKMLKKDWRSIITITGKVGEDHEQLHDKPEGEDELNTLASHFNHFNEIEIWEFIRSTGFHELIPIH